MSYLDLLYVSFFKCLLILSARASIFVFNKAVYGTFIEFKYYSSSPVIKRAFENITLYVIVLSQPTLGQILLPFLSHLSKSITYLES